MTTGSARRAVRATGALSVATLINSVVARSALRLEADAEFRPAADTTTADVLALMLMRAVVIAVAVPGYLIGSRWLACPGGSGQAAALAASLQGSPA